MFIKDDIDPILSYIDYLNDLDFVEDNSEDVQSFLGIFNKSESEKKISQDDSLIFNNNNREEFSPKLNLDLSEGESKKDMVKENSIFIEEISQIYKNPEKKVRKKRKNESFSNSDPYDIKLRNRTLDNIIFLKENKEDCCLMNDKYFNLNETQVKYYDSQDSFSNNKNNNEARLLNISKNYSSVNNDDIMDISSLQSKISIFPPLTPNITQLDFPCPNYIKPNDSINLPFSNQKRKRSKNKVIKSFPIIENNFLNNSEDLAKKDKKKLFTTKKKIILGEKKKNSGKNGKHGKNSNDNLRSKVKTCSLNFLYEYFNEEIPKIDINDLNKSVDWKLYKKKYVDNKTKVYNLDLLNQSLKSIFSAPISGRYNKTENHNKELIDKIYKINQEGNSEKTKKIIKFFNMKYKEFFNYVKIIKDNKNLQEKIDGLDDDIKDMVKKFDFYLEENLSKDNKDKDYNQKLIALIKNFPEDINNMIVKKKKK